MGNFDGAAELPRHASAMHALFGDDEPRAPTLGEFDAESYPDDLADLLRRRAQVLAALLDLDLSAAESRRQAIPALQALLRQYPHPLLYEALIHGYVDAGRWDEARGLTFAARNRRAECERSHFPEIRSELDHLRPWTAEDVDELRHEREASAAN